jgi:YD repeat-containing protein
MTVRDGAKVVLTERGKITINGPGKEDFSISAPFMYDEARAFAPKAAARYSLRKTATGYRVTLALDEAWLRDAKRRFPVTVDPTVMVSGSAQTVDASLLELAPDSGYGGSEGIFVGEYASWPGGDNRGVLRFDLSDVPSDAKVLQARLSLKSYYTENSSAKEMGLHALTRSFTHDATWNDHDGENAWASAGGDFDSEPAAVATVGDALGWHSWYPTELVQEWVEGSRENHGLLLKDLPGEPTNGTEFRSSEYGTAADRPYVDVMWHPRTGDLPVYTYDEHRLADGTVVKVNVRNGNVVYARPAAFGTGPGEDFIMGHYFNSMLEASSTHGGFGVSPWVAANGKWVGLTVMDNGDVIHHGLTGYVLPFIKQGDGSFTSPAELDATLTEDGGASWDERYELEFRDGSKMTFSGDGTWTSHTDRDDNTYTLNYPSPSYQHTSVTGTDDEDTTFTYTTGSQSQDLIATVTSPDDTEFTYGYTSDRLTSETHESDTLVTYGYDGNGRLASITDGDSNTVDLAFDTDGRLEALTQDSDETAYAYASPTESCDENATDMTTVSDPDGRAEDYCFAADGAKVASPTAISGQTSGDLVVEPSRDPQTASFTSTGVAWAIARMPADKTVAEVTLGDFGKASGCSDATTATLHIHELQNGTGDYGSFEHIGTGAAASVSGSPGQVTWDVSGDQDPYVVLQRDKAYRFTVEKETGCNLVRTTWRHDAAFVDGGARRCTHGTEGDPFGYISSRIWHQYGQADGTCGVIDMPSNLLSGWYAARQYGFGDQKRVTAAQGFDVNAFVPLQVACNDHVNNTEALSFGISWVPFGVVAGVGDAACSYGGRYAPFGVKPAGGWHYVPNWTGDAPRRPRAMYAKLTSVTYTDLLEDHAPRLVLDSEENYNPDAWQTATDVPAGLLRSYWATAGGGFLAEVGSTPPGLPALTEQWLIPENADYPSNAGVASEHDYLDFGSHRGRDLADDASDVRAANPSKYQDKTYARAVNADGVLYLQYWFWWINNHAHLTGASNHEGDWEFIQIRLNSSFAPEAATYSQHTSGETCLWSDVPRTNDGRPVVYPARNRHANYFEPGERSLLGLIGRLVPGVADVTDGDGRAVDPDVVDVSTEPDFLKWPGRWGASLGSPGNGFVDADSPRGPRYQPTWNPARAEQTSHECTAG